MKVFVIVQARMGSSRYPGKILESIKGKTALWYIAENLKHCKNIHKVIIATTNLNADDKTHLEASKLDYDIFRGDEINVFSRFIGCAEKFEIDSEDLILRLTADDIFIDPAFLDAIIDVYKSTYPKIRFMSNANYPGFPYGFFFEIFDCYSLLEASKTELTSYDLEHVTPAIKRVCTSNILNLMITNNYEGINLSLDTKEDKIRIELILEELANKNETFIPMNFADIIDAYEKVNFKNIRT